jgi:hypothetical protein
MVLKFGVIFSFWKIMKLDLQQMNYQVCFAQRQRSFWLRIHNQDKKSIFKDDCMDDKISDE